MKNYNDHLIKIGSLIKSALVQLNFLSKDPILFVVDINNKLLGSITDGDIRRGLLNQYNLDDKIDNIIQRNTRFIQKGNSDIFKIIDFRNENLRLVPIIDFDFKVINILNFRNTKSFLPLDVVIMAGGKGKRLRPLTNTKPKPMLNIKNKPILEHIINHLKFYGIENYWVSINYLGNIIENYFGDGEKKQIKINYVHEEFPLGTIGAVSKIKNFQNDNILLLNSDLLTNVDYEKFYLDFLNKDADMSILTIPYKVNIPYAIINEKNNKLIGIKEKPTYTYQSNGGVYLIKKTLLKHIPKDSFFNATDLVEVLLSKNLKITTFSFRGYWLDVGRKEDYIKAQMDIHNIII